jgi:hypothetical protein
LFIRVVKARGLAAKDAERTSDPVSLFLWLHACMQQQLPDWKISEVRVTTITKPDFMKFSFESALYLDFVFYSSLGFSVLSDF